MTDAPAAGLRARSKARRMEAIQHAAEELFASHGYEAVTTKEIAERAEVGEATLFRYVPNKHDLLLLILGKRLDALLEEIRSRDADLARGPQTAKTIRGRVDIIYRARSRFYQEDPENVTSYLWHGFRAESSLGAHGVEQGDEIISLVRAILAEGVELGVVNPHTPTDIVAKNCNALYIHEVLRGAVRDSVHVDLWERLQPRLAAQLEPVFRM